MMITKILPLRETNLKESVGQFQEYYVIRLIWTRRSYFVRIWLLHSRPTISLAVLGTDTREFKH